MAKKSGKSNSKFIRWCFATGACSASGSGKSRKVNINESKIKKVESQFNDIPKTFGLNLNKMKSIKLPKDIKTKGINSNEYKKWIWDNWH